MNQLPCPWCGVRDDREFTWGDEVHGARPEFPERLTDSNWADYLYVRPNVKGVTLERWCHTYGCRQWFSLIRDTATHRIYGAYLLDEAPPELSE